MLLVGLVAKRHSPLIVTPWHTRAFNELSDLFGVWYFIIVLRLYLVDYLCLLLLIVEYYHKVKGA